MRPCFLILLLLLPTAGAHYVTEHFLQGARLCLDPSSVQVEVHGDGSTPDELLASIMQRRLSQSLTRSFSTYRVAFEERESCAGSPDFVLLHLLVFHLSAMGLTVTDDYPYTYTASLQVGQHVTGEGLEVENDLPNARYNVIESFIFSETLSGQPFHGALPERNEAMLRHLVAAWWLDNRCPWAAPRSLSCHLADLGWLDSPVSGSSFLPQALGVLLAMIVAMLARLIVSRLKRRLLE